MQEIENVLSEMCHDRDEPTEEECDEAADTDFLPPFQPPNGEGARLTMSSSISLLSRYHHVTVDLNMKLYIFSFNQLQTGYTQSNTRKRVQLRCN